MNPVRLFGFSFVCVFSVACSSSNSSTGPVTGGDGGAVETGGATINEKGTVLVYPNGRPASGLTVTDGTQSGTTDAQGNFALPAPAGASLQTVVTGPKYTTLFLPEATSATGDVDRKRFMVPDTGALTLAQQITSCDTTQAVVYVTIEKVGACTSVDGGTLTLRSPQGAQFMYFNSYKLPSATQTSIVDTPDMPVALIYNVPPGSDFDIQVDHPTCKMVPFPATRPDGTTFSGKVTTKPMQPGDNNSALAVVMQ